MSMYKAMPMKHAVHCCSLLKVSGNNIAINHLQPAGASTSDMYVHVSADTKVLDADAHVYVVAWVSGSHQ